MLQSVVQRSITSPLHEIAEQDRRELVLEKLPEGSVERPTVDCCTRHSNYLSSGFLIYHRRRAGFAWILSIG